ncbi:MAG: site-specific integrase [Terracidiphilus sp.]|nr:site-specific integrase [Terracidiphilus sp.]
MNLRARRRLPLLRRLDSKRFAALWQFAHWLQGKDDLGFKVKDSEQREVPIIGDLLDDLKKWKDEHPKTRLVVGTDSDRPNTHLLRQLKRLAKQENLNCGRCSGCRSALRECQEWQLHKFRRTYATKLLRNGVDLRTVQALMGHSDLDSTLRYLRPAEADELQGKLAKIAW